MKIFSKVTIDDVAARAGVSIKTVSRVVNNEANVLQKTRDTVLKAMRDLNYRPKQSARSLAGARSFLIGLLYYDPSASFVEGVQRGATLACRETGHHLVVESLDVNAADLDMQIDRMISALRPDGMILTPPLCDDQRVLDALNATNTPCVLISPGRGQTLPSVRMDDERAAEEVTDLLLSLGHTRIGFIEGPPDQVATHRRRVGFERSLRAHGLSISNAVIAKGDFTFASGVTAAQALLGEVLRPTAVFASNDEMALGALSVAQRLGIKVPEDLSIAGFDDTPVAARVWPPLTTVRQPIEEMALFAVEMLVKGATPDESQFVALENDANAPTSAERVAEHRIVVRQSTFRANVSSPS